jgi:hypothetical protein
MASEFIFQSCAEVSEYAMTWSIVARDCSGAFGIALASRFFPIGVLCPHELSWRRPMSESDPTFRLSGARIDRQPVVPHHCRGM